MSPSRMAVMIRGAALVASLGACAGSPPAPAPAPVLQSDLVSSEQVDPHLPRPPRLHPCVEPRKRSCLDDEGADEKAPFCAVSRTGERFPHEGACSACMDPEIIGWWEMTCEALAQLEAQ